MKNTSELIIRAIKQVNKVYKFYQNNKINIYLEENGNNK